MLYLFNIGSSSVPDQYKAWLQAVNSMISRVKKSVEEEDLMLIAMLPCQEGHLYLEMKNYLKKIAGNPLLPLLEITCQQHKTLDVLFKEAAADPDLADYSPENEAKVQPNYTTISVVNVNSMQKTVWQECYHKLGYCLVSQGPLDEHILIFSKCKYLHAK